MGLISGQRANTGLIEVFQGTAYDNVKLVADNMDAVIASPANAQLAAAKAAEAAQTVADLQNWSDTSAANAVTATTKAGEAEAAKVAAEAAAVTATTKANLTTTKANEVAANTLAAAESASTATAQATIATNKAALTVTKATAAESAALQAAQSAAAILGSVSTATEQARIATTKASEAANHAATVAGSVAVVVQRTDEVTTKLATVTTKAGLAEAAAASAANAAVAAGTSASAAAAEAEQSRLAAETATLSAGTATEKSVEAVAAAANALAKAQEALNSANTAAANLETALPVSAYIKDVHRHAVERASGGRQTVLYDDLGNPSVMNIIPIFRYEDLGYTAAMGTGVATCFDVGTGTNKSEIFIGAFQSSLVGSRAVSLPRTNQAINVNFDTAKTYCANKGAGWHLMTMHEWAAISLWCMANGFEPRGNTNYGRAHDRYVERGRRMDGRLPGDTAGTARVHAGSGPDAWRHNNSPWGISDMVGNVWEWLDGFKLQDGQIIASTFNTQAEASWVAQAAYFDATLVTGGAPKLSDAVVNRLGTIGNNQNAGYAANGAFNVMTKADTYVSNQLLKRLLVQPATVLPKGWVYMRNFGERLPSRGGSWDSGNTAGLAALNCYNSRVGTSSTPGFRLAFA